MKRLFFSLVVLTIGASVFASVTRKCWITLTSDQGGSDVVKIYENTDRNHTFENNYDATKNMNTSYDFSVNIYVRVPNYIPNDSLGTVMTNDISNYPISIKTNKLTQSYTMTFSNVSGTIKLYDLAEDSIIIMANSGTYKFTAPVDVIVKDRFYIEPLFEYPRLVANNGWATICFPWKFETSTTGVASLYKLTAINSAGTQVALDAVAMADAVAGVPYIFQSNSTEAKQVFKYIPTNKVLAPVVEGTNGLNGVFADSTLTEQKWVITNNAVTPAAAGSFVGQYRCFIDLGATPVDDAVFTQQVPGRRIFNVKNTPTELEDVNANVNANRKVMIDGKLIIMKDGKMFNAQGAQL